MSDLPPLEQPQAYVVIGPNDQRGPYTLDLLIGEVVAGRLYDTTPVWWPGLDQWTTMGAHPGVVAEVARRRAGAAPAQAQQQPEPQTAYQTQPAPQPESQTAYQTQPAPQPEPQTAYQTQPAPQPEPQVQTTYQPQPEQPAQPEPTVGYQPQPEQITAAVPEGEAVAEPAAVAEVSQEAVAGGPGAAPVPDEHRSTFQRLVERSRARSEGGDRIARLDQAFLEAVSSGAESQGFTATDRSSGETNHELRFDGGPGETLGITLGRIKGDDPSEVRTAAVPFTVRFQSATYGGSLDSGTGEHGEVVVVSDEWSGQATSTVGLLLALEDYVDAGLDVDAAKVVGDVGATVSVVSGRMR